MAIHELNFKNSSGLQIVISTGDGGKITKFHSFGKNGGKELTWRWTIMKHDAIVDCLTRKGKKRELSGIIETANPYV